MTPRSYPAELFHVFVLEILPAEADRTATTKLAVIVVFRQKVGDNLVQMTEISMKRVVGDSKKGSKREGGE